jgi:hypothetical protein
VADKAKRKGGNDMKGIMIYSETFNLLKELTMSQRGEFITYLSDYLESGIIPKIDNIAVRLVFITAKEKYERDSEAYNARCVKNRENISKRWEKDTNVYDRNQSKDVVKNGTLTKPNQTKPNLNKKERVKKAMLSPSLTLEEKQKQFQEELNPFMEKYDEEMVKKFFIYWAEPNLQGTKMKKEMEKTWSTAGRLARWQNMEGNRNGK